MIIITYKVRDLNVQYTFLLFILLLLLLLLLFFLPEVPWIPQALQKLSGDFKTKCILGWLRLVKILLLKRAIKGNSVKTLDSDGKALVKIACFSRISGCTS